MQLQEYANIYRHEETHFFYVSLHRLILKLIEKYLPNRHLGILDAGCGTGGLMSKLKHLGNLRGIDFSPEAIKLAKRRRLNVVRASVLDLPFPAKSFDLVTCIDVLYHRGVVDDVKALLELKRVLKKGGVLIVRVQADKTLKTAHDRYVHSKRRYTKKELTSKIKKAGLQLEMISYIHSPLWPIAKLMLMVEKIKRDKSAKSGVGQTSSLVNHILTRILGLEADMVLRGFRPPIGMGIIAVAQRTR